LKTIHEYLSDEKVILQDFEPDEYKMLLIRQQLGYIYELANYFNHSVTLKRIHMLNRIKSPKLAKLKYLLVIPIIGILPFLFSFSDKPFDDGNQVAEVRDTILTEADEMPVFPGGESALLTFIAKNVKYPEVSKKNGIQGKVFVQFMVDKTGKVKAIEVLQGVSKELDAEAVRVIKLLPNFEKPAYKDGKPVNVKMVLPIMFKLQ
jgi:TonB family protein